MILKICCVLMAVCFSCGTVLAQDDSLSAGSDAKSGWFLGAGMGYGMELMETDIPTYVGTTKTEDGSTVYGPAFGSVDGSHVKIALFGDLVLADLGFANLYGTAQLAYAVGNSSKHIQGDRLPSLDSAGNVVYYSVYYDIAIDVNRISGGIGAGLQFSKFGFDVSFLMDGVNKAQTTTTHNVPKLNGWDEIVFDTTTTVYDKASHNSVLYGAQVAFKFMIDAERVQIQIAPYYRYYFNSVHTFANTKMQVVALDLRVGIR